jgi:hypothetical protein
MTSPEKQNNLPAFIKEVTGDVELGYWEPQTLAEWAEVQKTAVSLQAWVQQQQEERKLRRMVGIWVFILMSVQIVGVFALVTLDAMRLLALNATLVKLLIPSVLAEVFGMGYVVVKYLFTPTNRTPFGGKSRAR